MTTAAIDSGRIGGYTGPFAAEVNKASRSTGIDPFWIAAIVYVESRFKRTAHSSAGAEGPAQILLSAHPGVSKAQADDPSFAIPWLARYLASLRKIAGGSLLTATKFYNTGPNASQSTLDRAGTAYLDQVQAAYRDLRSRYNAGGSSGAAGLSGKLAWPLALLGKIIGHPYEGTHRDFGNWESDNAVDIAVPKGTPVYAVDAGTIGSQIGQLASASSQLAGERLHLQTASDEFYYAHLSRLVVRAGQKVKKGQLLGYSGEANGVEHLHIAEKATYRPDFASNTSKAQEASIWGSVKSVAKTGSKWFFDPIGSAAGLIPGVGGAVKTVTSLADLPGELVGFGKTFADFISDPLKPLLYLLFLGTGFAILYLGITRLFGTRPIRDVVIPAAGQAAEAGALA